MIEPAVNKTLEIMNLSNRGLAKLLNIDVHTITENKSKDWAELTPKTYKKIGAICTLVNQDYQLLRSQVILEVLNQHVFKDIDGKRYSVLSAINSDKFDLEGVIEIGKLALATYREKQLKLAPSVPSLPHVVSA